MIKIERFKYTGLNHFATTMDLEHTLETSGNGAFLQPGTMPWEQPVLLAVIERMKGIDPILERATPFQLYDLLLQTAKHALAHRMKGDDPLIEQNDPKIMYDGLHPVKFSFDFNGHYYLKLYKQSKLLWSAYRTLQKRINELKKPEEKQRDFVPSSSNIASRLLILLREEEFVQQPLLVNYLSRKPFLGNYVIGNIHGYTISGYVHAMTFDAYVATKISELNSALKALDASSQISPKNSTLPEHSPGTQ